MLHLCLRLLRPTVAAVVVVLVAGCASYEPAPQQQSALGCDEAVSQGSAFGRGPARAIAINSLRYQIDDVRGYLLNQGFRHVRPAKRTVTCLDHAFGYGFVQCTAVARLCGG
jgi:hypothetical protein